MGLLWFAIGTQTAKEEQKRMTAIEEYILAAPEEHQPRLNEIRKLILGIAPELKEKISWGMPTFYLKRNIIHFALNKAHTGIYPGALAMEAFKDKLTEYKTSKGAWQIPHTKELPVALLSDLTQWCMEHNNK